MIRGDVTISGLQETQAALNQILAELKPRGAAGRAVHYVTTGALSYAQQITHIDTGTLRASHRAQIDLSQQPRGTIFIDRAAVNPRTGERAADYGKKEEARGGSHAFYRRTEAERGVSLLAQGGEIIRGAMPRGR